MCGIAGVVGAFSSRREAVQVMQRELLHRGPDDGGEFHDDECSLGMRRLSIIDLSGGHQPQFNETGEIVGICNGELYDFQAARRQLQQRGHTFATQSDTEVAIHAYESEGDRFPAGLNGMFALALWDRGRHRLLLARDRIGKKPLYYTIGSGWIAFASELRTLLTLRHTRWTVDRSACREFLSFGYMPADRTPILEIRRLPPGCVGIWADDELTLQRYWEPSPSPVPPDEAEAEQALLALLDSAVMLRLVSDVPVGAFISGGLDSSVVVAIAASRLGARVPTFNIAFPNDADHDEAQHARRLAAYLGCEHHEIPVTPDAFHDVRSLVWTLDEPLADPAALPTLLLSTAARRAVTVVLTGEGADEVFGGYERYALALLGSSLSRRLHPLRWFAERTLSTRGPRRLDDSRPSRLLRALAAAGPDPLAWSRSVAYIPALTDPEQGTGNGGWRSEHATQRVDSSRLLPVQLDDMATLLPNGLLTKVDRMTMAAAVEARCPYLDYRVVQFGLGLPDRWKIRGRTTKVLLRRLARKLLPRDLTGRRKHTFRVPLGRWLRGPMRPLAREATTSPLLQTFGVVPRDSALRLAEDHVAGRADFTRSLWALITLQLWLAEATQRFALEPES